MLDLSGLLLYMAVSMFTPGPNNLTMMFLGANFGLRGARKFLVASALSLLCKTFLCGVLNLALADLIPPLVGYLKWLGAGYMLYLAWTMGRSGWRGGDGMTARRSEATYGAGILLQCLNMKSWVSCLSLFAVYVVPVTGSVGVIAAVSVGYFAIMVAASLLWGAFGSAIRGVYAKYRKPLSLLMAASLVYCAGTALL